MNDNKQAIQFTIQCREIAARLTNTYVELRKMLAVYGGQSIADVIPADGEEIADGADVSGIPIATNAKVLAVVALSAEICALLEADNNAKLNAAVALTSHGAM